MHDIAIYCLAPTVPGWDTAIVPMVSLNSCSKRGFLYPTNGSACTPVTLSVHNVDQNNSICASNCVLSRDAFQELQRTAPNGIIKQLYAASVTSLPLDQTVSTESASDAIFPNRSIPSAAESKLRKYERFMDSNGQHNRSFRLCLRTRFAVWCSLKSVDQTERVCMCLSLSWL